MNRKSNLTSDPSAEATTARVYAFPVPPRSPAAESAKKNARKRARKEQLRRELEERIAGASESEPREIPPSVRLAAAEAGLPRRGRLELVELARAGAAAADAWTAQQFPLGAVVRDGDDLAAFNILAGDVLRCTLDGDAEHGELAIVSAGDDRRGRPVIFAAFVFVEGARFCLRRESLLECDGAHHPPESLTIIGRVVRVERGGLPVRLKGLELRGLPFAE